MLLDIYAWQGFKTAFRSLSPAIFKILKFLYWGSSIFTFTGLAVFALGGFAVLNPWMRMVWQGSLMVVFLPKIILFVFTLIDDVIRLVRLLIDQFKQSKTSSDQGITRSEFIAQTGVLVASVPFLGTAWGIVNGAHDYRVRRVSFKHESVSRALHGFKIVQLSDIHSGSFWSKKAVQRGIDMVRELEPDLVLFTGDIVNDTSDELEPWLSEFGRITAPHGVYSVLGNHDYGDYVQWPSEEAKKANLERLIAMQKSMGWKVLLDEHVFIGPNKDLALIGIQNWGAKGRFPKYGNLEKAYQGAESAAFKLLMSHDPSHWRAEVLEKYKDIHLMLAGHTHGAQFGIETAKLKWSPVKYMYEEWAGLYQENKQFLYVNRGFGYIGYPGRFGIRPEITLLELESVA